MAMLFQRRNRNNYYFNFQRGSGNNQPCSGKLSPVFEEPGRKVEVSLEEKRLWENHAARWTCRKSIENLQPLATLCMRKVADMMNKEETLAKQIPIYTIGPEMQYSMICYLKANNLRIAGYFAQQLLNEKSVFFDFGIVRKGKEQRQVFQYMLENCKAMKDIAWRDYHDTPFVSFPIEGLIEMINLEKIDMPDFWCELDDLVILANYFSGLKLLHVSMLQIGDAEREVLMQLNKLESLDFHGSKLSMYEKPTKDVETMAYLLLAIPNLQVLWPSSPVTCDHAKVLNSLSEHNMYPEIKLKKLCLAEAPKYDTDMLTQVEELYLTGDSHIFHNQMDFFLNWSKLRLLNIRFTFITKGFLQTTLSNLGPQLQELVIEVKDGHHWDIVLSISQIFNYCPQISKFHIEGNISCIDDCKFNSVDIFQNLRSVKISTTGSRFNSLVMNHVIDSSDDLEYLHIGPVMNFIHNGFTHHLILKLRRDPQSFRELKVLWLYFGSCDLTHNMADAIKNLAFQATKLEKVVLNAYQSHCAPMPFLNLTAFFEHFMPKVECIVF
ncbi:uncharacterized protein LOC132196683 isoform X2 [Neocloeon triangulifer]|uniref:uncharacterized protein LOC132196683 isoform X2 n=1 Tax=Neocloeon triangulifer TaxID=2078957 RepID=UPI00286ED5C8|nr:uncharacterized protein LOC132196683 isoform X2 [Neocloeon triangulifer]